MTKQKAEDGVALISRTRGQWIEDNGTASMRQNRWTALVHAAIGAMQVSTNTP